MTMDIKKSVIKLLKEYANRKKSQKESISYGDIGHNPKNKSNKLWWWFNDSEELVVVPADRSHPSSIRSDFEGRYDADKHLISLVDMGAYRKSNKAGQFEKDNTSIENVPENLIRRLKFEFGDNISIKTYFEESVKLNQLIKV